MTALRRPEPRRVRSWRPFAARLADRALPSQERARLRALVYHDAGHGFDVFGLHPDGVALAAALLGPLYRHWFRVRSRGAEQIPARGPAILVANHGGMLPLDAAMLWLDVLTRTSPPRPVRTVADYFVASLPFVGTFFARGGVVGGSRGNAHHLLDAGELLAIFPEGTVGIGKPSGQAYRLQAWRVGHAELSIRHRAPVIPVAIVGPDEQWPELARLDVHPFGAPYVPIPASPLPLPVRYHIRYGAPLALHAGLAPDAADDPDVVAAAALRTRAAVQSLIDDTLRERKGLFA